MDYPAVIDQYQGRATQRLYEQRAVVQKTLVELR